VKTALHAEHVLMNVHQELFLKAISIQSTQRFAQSAELVQMFALTRLFICQNNRQRFFIAMHKRVVPSAQPFFRDVAETISCYTLFIYIACAICSRLLHRPNGASHKPQTSNLNSQTFKLSTYQSKSFLTPSSISTLCVHPKR